MIEVISRTEAKRIGLKRYFTGKPCKHGHVSERWVDGSCVQCRKMPERQEIKKAYDKIYNVVNKESKANQNAAWREKNKDKLKEYHNRKEVKDRANAFVRADRAANPEKYRSYDRDRYLRRREDRLRKDRNKRYGIADDQYNTMLLSQGGRCAISGWEETAIDANSGRLRSLSVDHCHSTGKIRGLLHGGINRAIGFFKEDTDLMRKAIEYIEKNRTS